MIADPGQYTDRLLRRWAWITGVGSLLYLTVAIVGVRVFFRSEIRMQTETHNAAMDLLQDLRDRQEQAKHAAQLAAEAAADAAQVAANAAVVTATQQDTLLKGQHRAKQLLEIQNDRQLLSYKLFAEIRDICSKMLTKCK